MSEKIKTAVIVGEHPYDVQSFQKAFTDNGELEVFIQNLEFFAATPKEIRESYDIVVLYNFHMATPTPETAWGAKAALEQLGDTKQGILVLHHAILAYPQWEFWSELCGIQNRGFTYHIGETVNYRIEKEHPITDGVEDFTMVDETYGMDSAGTDSDILVTTEHNPSMRSILWTRKFKNARVVCFESGHDNAAYSNPSFRRLLHNSIKWLAYKI